MYHKITKFLPFFLLFVMNIASSQYALAQKENCVPEDRECILRHMVITAADIDNKKWKDQTYREIAKTYAFDGHFDKATALLNKITTPDTKALTIRGIGMAIAPQSHKKESLNKMFVTLRDEAEKITHPPSYAIALTYIAMAQAFAGDNKGAWITANDMKNDALRHKAYGETAEIQAEKGDFKSAKISIEKIESLAFRNKAFSTVSKILAGKKLYKDAYNAAQSITNPYKKTQSLQYILDTQKPRDMKQK